MDSFTEEDIRGKVKQILNEMGITNPPVRLSDVLDFLETHQEYYDLSDTNLLEEVSHKLKVGLYKVKEVVSKIDLKGLWLPDQNKILISDQVPEIKQRWISAHEIGHRIIPWHKDFIFGDTAETLDPSYHEMLENEANFAASELLFLGSQFSIEASDYTPSLKAISELAKSYGNSQTMTLRRFVQYANKDQPMLGVISKPHWKNIGIESNQLCRYFLPSKLFSKRFPKVRASFIIDQLKEYLVPKRGGPVGSGEIVLVDCDGGEHCFSAESFFNSYDVLTLIVYNKIAVGVF